MMGFLLSIIRRTVSCKFNPARDLIASSTQPFEWTSTGESPVFDLEPEGGKGDIPTGWVYVESKLVRRGERLVARLYVDTGSGCSDTESFVIPATRVGNIRHIVRIPSGARRLRLAPLQGEGTIRVDFFRLTKISRIEKFVRMAEWVAGDIIKFKNTNQARKYNLTWGRLLTDLEGAYADCANLRFHSSPPEYASYIDEFDTLLHTDIDAIRRHVAAFRQRQLISILVPVGNAPVDYLKSSVQSVLDQAYENWQLCIAADGSASDEVVSYLKSLPSMEGRVKIVFLETGGRTAAALNNALEMAAGEFSVILYPGDLLSVHSLYFISLKINESSGLNIIYSDEDEIDSHGVRSNARFKSGWNPDLFLSHDMISRLAAYKTSLLRGIGGFRVEFEGGQDYDLALRCVNGSDSVQIAHVSRVLYHRRQENESALGDFHAQDQACLARERALSDFLKDQPGVVVSRGSLAGTFRVNYPVPTPAPKVSVIIPTRDGGPLLKKCIQSVLHETEYENIELIVVDNQSEGDETVAYLRLLEGRADVKVLRYDFPFNYSSINNFAAKHASGEILCFLNDDVEATRPDWLKEMVSHALRPEIGVVGAKLLYADNFIQHAGVVIGIGGFAGHAHRLYPATHPGYAGRAVLTQNLSAVTGACLVMRGKLFADIGGFDEKNLPVAFNDVDLCLRVREAGYRVLWTPHAVLYHYESYSRGDDQASPEKRARFNREKDFMVARWNVSNFNDPYYNGNLTLDREDFSFANFPRINNPWRDFARV